MQVCCSAYVASWHEAAHEESGAEDSGGHAGFEHAHGFLRHLIDVGTILRLLARDHYVGLEHDAPGKGLPSRAFGPFQRVVRATSTHGTYIKSVAVGAALFQNRTAR